MRLFRAIEGGDPGARRHRLAYRRASVGHQIRAGLADRVLRINLRLVDEAPGHLLRQRALVLQRLRQMGVDIIEAPWDRIGYRLIDRYLEIKRSEAIG